MTEPIRKAIAQIDGVTCEQEIPIEAVDALLETSPDNELLEIILDRLGNMEYNEIVQFCYAVVGGMNITDELFDPVLKILCGKTDYDNLLESECLNLLSALCCIYPEKAGPIVMTMLPQLKRPQREKERYFLYEAFYYLPLDEYGEELIKLCDWEPVKILKKRLRVILADRFYMMQVPEDLLEAFGKRITLSKDEFVEDIKHNIPFFELRQFEDWKEYYKPGESEPEQEEDEEEDEELVKQAELLEAEKQKVLEKTKRSEAKRLYNGQRVHRNEPCPCGSGKKFKKCCGR